MKTALLLLTSSLVIAGSGAFAQGNTDACHNQYGACMERCSTRPASLQESCSNSCESTTNVCYGELYGPGKAAQTIQSTPAPEASAQATEAGEARDEAKPAKVKKKKN